MTHTDEAAKPLLARMPLVVAALVSLVGSVGFATCLWMAFGSMTDVITHNGGMCASGGPYEIDAAHRCSSGSSLLIGIGGPGLFVFGAVAAVGVVGVLGPRGVGHLLLMGTLVFGLLGWNFLRLRGTDPSLLFCGVLFLLMASAGLIGLVPILGLRRPAVDPGRGTRHPALVSARRRQWVYWSTVAGGTLLGALLGQAIVGALLQG